MAATISGLSTLGVSLSYGVETTAGQKPSAFTVLDRINAISGISMDTEQIDSSSLEDLVSRYIPGRQDSGGDWTVTINYTSETEQQWKDAIAAYNTAQASNLNVWFQVVVPNQANAFFVVAGLPQEIPMPDFSQNELLTVDIVLSIVEYKGTSAKVV